MKTTPMTLIVSLSTLALGDAFLRADSIQLADGSSIEGTLGAPAAIIVKTATGEQRVPFALLAPEVQKRYWNKAAIAESTPTPTANSTAVTDEEMDALASEVALDAWSQIAAIGSFRDKPEKRGAGGLVVTKAFNALEENWVSVYSPKDPVGMAGNWNNQLIRARAMQGRATQFMQKRWLDLFITVGEAVGRRDSNEFAAAMRELKRSTATSQPAPATDDNFFTAK